MKNKIIISTLLIIAIMTIAGCTPLQDNADYTFKLKTHGGFTIPEENVYEFVITKDKATLTVSDIDGKIARVEEANITQEEYNKLRDAFLENDFKTLKDVYEPADVMIIDAATGDITMKSETFEKTITLQPYIPNEYNQRIQNIAEALEQIEKKFWH